MERDCHDEEGFAICDCGLSTAGDLQGNLGTGHLQ